MAQRNDRRPGRSGRAQPRACQRIQNPAYRPASAYLIGLEDNVTKPKRPLCSKSRPQNLLQHPLLREAYELGKGFGISDDNFKPAWEKEWVKKIITESDL